MDRRPASFRYVAVSASLLSVFVAGCNTQSDTVTIRYAHNYPTNSPRHSAAEAFKAEVERRSDGRMRVNIFPAQQLGGLREQLELLQQGSVQITVQTVAAIGNFVPRFQVLDLPYVFPNEEVMWRTLDGPYGERMLSFLNDQNMHGIGFVWSGFKQLTAARRIQKLEDLSGLKMRVIPSPLLISLFEGWGTNPVGIDLAELYNALQQRVVDGQDNGYWTIDLQNHDEVQPYLAETDHAALLFVVIVNKQWYDALSPEYRQIVAEAGRDAVLRDREELRNVEDAARQRVRDSGVEIYVVPAAERARFREAAKPAFDYIANQLGPEAIAELEAAVRVAE